MRIGVDREVRTLRRREKSPAISFQHKGGMSELSVFVDEASNFGPYERHNSFYVLTLVFHDQKIPIKEDVRKLHEALANTRHIAGKAIHTGPLIRQNEDYTNQTIDDRRKQFFKLLAFLRRCPVSYTSLVFPKKDFGSIQLVGRMSRELSLFIRGNVEFFQSFDRVLVYYDGGQAQVSQVLTSVFNALLFEVEFRRVTPADYYLFQAADLICTVELLAAKRDCKLLTKSDTHFFYKPQELKRIIKEVRKKRFGGG
jgi:hypothetical protein